MKKKELSIIIIVSVGVWVLTGLIFPEKGPLQYLTSTYLVCESDSTFNCLATPVFLVSSLLNLLIVFLFTYFFWKHLKSIVHTKKLGFVMFAFICTPLIWVGMSYVVFFAFMIFFPGPLSFGGPDCLFTGIPIPVCSYERDIQFYALAFNLVFWFEVVLFTQGFLKKYLKSSNDYFLK